MRLQKIICLLLFPFQPNKCKIPQATGPYMLAFMLVIIVFPCADTFTIWMAIIPAYLGIFATKTLFIFEDILLVHCCNLAKCACQSVSDVLLFRLMCCIRYIRRFNVKIIVKSLGWRIYPHSPTYCTSSTGNNYNNKTIFKWRLIVSF